MKEYIEAFNWREKHMGIMGRERDRIVNSPNSHRLDGRPVSSAKIAEDLLIIRLSLELADLYYWTPEMAAAILAAAADFPLIGHTPTFADLPSEYGCFYFPTPLAIGDMRIEAILWMLTCVEPDGALALHRPVGDYPHWDRGDHLPDGLALSVMGWMPADTPSGSDGLLGVNHIRFDQAMTVSLDAHTPTVLAGGFFFAACSFLASRIMTTTREDPDRATRRRAERAGQSTAPVRVIQLRRRESSAGAPSGPSSPVDWSCQWIVSGHWRKQFIPSTGGHKTIRIFPYTKGPADKPLKTETAARVFKVAR